jgi:hypothetical protein
VLNQPVLRDGQWQLLECRPAWDGNWTRDSFVACAWTGNDGSRRLVAVNYSDHFSQCYVEIPWKDFEGGLCRLRDRAGSSIYDRDGNALTARGLYLDMPAWAYYIFELERA